MKLEIVMFNMSSYAEWKKGVVNRNYHVLHRLLKHPLVGRVVAVDFLPFTYKRGVRNYWETIIKKSKIRNQKSEIIYRDLTAKCTKIDGYSAELYVFSTIDSIFSHKLVIKKLNKVLGKINPARSDLTRLVWSYFPMFVKYFTAPARGWFASGEKGGSASGGDGIKADLTVFDAVDNWIEHPSFAQHKNVLTQNYKIISEKSDIIFTVAEPLIEFFKSFGREKHIYWISNGVDINHFLQKVQPTDSTSRSDLLVGIPRPIIGYVGTIQHRVDFDLLKYVIDHHPDKSFVFVGPIWKNAGIEKLKKHSNVYFLGRKPYDLVPAYIKQFDACIIPHKLDKFIKYTYSLKMLDYLACGKPVVTLKTPETRIFSDYLYIADNYADFSKKLDIALKSDTIELHKKRIERAKEEDWRLKVDEMIKILRGVL